MAAPDLPHRLGDLSPADRDTITQALARDAELAADLGPLLDGRYGAATEQLFLRHFADRLRASDRPRDALLPALADAMRVAKGDTGST